MKILIITDSLDVGGAETHIEALALSLCELGCDVVIASQGGQIADKLKTSKIAVLTLPSFTVTAHRKTNQAQSFSFLSYSVSKEVLKRIIRRERPDIVHAHTRKTAFLARSICDRAKIPLITTAHAMFTMSIVKSALSVWGDGTIAISEDIKEHIIKKSLFKPKKVSIIRNGIRY